MFDISNAAWYVDLGIIAGVLVSVGTIWRLLLWPVLHTVWVAVTSAPKISEGVGKLVELIESDVLDEIRNVKESMHSHFSEAEGRDLQLTDHDHRIGKLEDVVFPLRKDN